MFFISLFCFFATCVFSKNFTMNYINETNYSESIKYNANNIVNVSFGHAADWYISNIPILKICCLKHQS